MGSYNYCCYFYARTTSTATTADFASCPAVASQGWMERERTFLQAYTEKNRQDSSDNSLYNNSSIQSFFQYLVTVCLFIEHTQRAREIITLLYCWDCSGMSSLETAGAVRS